MQTQARLTDSHAVCSEASSPPLVLCVPSASEQVNALVSEAFVQFFVRLVGHYGSHIKWGRSGSGSFQERNFCKAMASKSCRRLLKKFVKTNMFSLFIEEAEKSRIPQEGDGPISHPSPVEPWAGWFRGRDVSCPVRGGMQPELRVLRALSRSCLLSMAPLLHTCQAEKINPHL